MAALFQSAIDGHQDGLRVGAALAPIAVTDFANDRGRPDGSFAGIVVVGHVGIIQERQQVVSVPPETLDQAASLRVFPRRGDEFGALTSETADKLPAQGERLELLAPHCDPNVNLYDCLYACRGDKVEAICPVAGRRAEE